MKREIKEIINYALDGLNMNSEDAASMVYRTGMAESGYRNLRQISGPALGFFQVEPATVRDTMENYVNYRTGIKTKFQYSFQLTFQDWVDWVDILPGGFYLEMGIFPKI